MMTIFWIVLITFVAAFLQAVIGFGFAVVAMAFMPLVIPYSKAIVVYQLICTFSTIYLAYKLRKDIQWKIMFPLLVPTVLLGAVGTVFSIKAPGDFMYLLLGGMLVALAVYFFLFSERIHIEPTPRNGWLMGMICGVCNGLFAIAGPTAVLYLLPATKEKQEYLATIQAFFAICNVVSIVMRIAMGSMALSDMPLVVCGWVAMFVATVLGVRLFSKIKAETFRKLVYAFIGANGAWIIISHFLGI